MSDLYTIVLEYDGGTYCDQVSARNEETAYKEWALRLRENPTTKHIGDKLELDAEDKLVPLDGLKNIWCLPLWFGFDHSDETPYIANMIKTSI